MMQRSPLGVRIERVSVDRTPNSLLLTPERLRIKTPNFQHFIDTTANSLQTAASIAIELSLVN